MDEIAKHNMNIKEKLIEQRVNIFKYQDEVINVLNNKGNLENEIYVTKQSKFHFKVRRKLKLKQKESEQ